MKEAGYPHLGSFASTGSYGFRCPIQSSLFKCAHRVLRHRCRMEQGLHKLVLGRPPVSRVVLGNGRTPLPHRGPVPRTDTLTCNQEESAARRCSPISNGVCGAPAHDVLSVVGLGREQTPAALRRRQNALPCASSRYLFTSPRMLKLLHQSVCVSAINGSFDVS